MITFNTRTRKDIPIDEQCRIFPDGGDAGTHDPANWLARLAPDWAEEALVIGDFYPEHLQGWWRNNNGKWEYELHTYTHNIGSWWDYDDGFGAPCRHTGSEAMTIAKERLNPQPGEKVHPFQNKYVIVVEDISVEVTRAEFWATFIAHND